ncbi:tetratricopeptide repeat protein [Nonomuraea sp. NPDC050556]|uniref:tetratricopeptide repeat protein n=1 Tax=Nonomuraea sp. NPDC050556 TaxID=3364369 RepID=UPI0037B898C4
MLFQDINRLTGYDERQRMIPTDRDALAALVAAVRDPEDYATLRALGVGLLLLGEYEAAKKRLSQALELAENDRMRLAAMVNLADAHRYSGDAGTSEELLREALELARGAVGDMVSFPLQHLGKTLGELGRVEEAREVLLEALALRQGQPELVAGTEAALRLLETS